MSKNTTSSSFRGIDVDQYGEDIYVEDGVAGGGENGEVSSPGPDDAEIVRLLNS